MDLPSIICITLSLCAVVQAAGMLLQTYEHTRYGRSRLRTRPANVFHPRVEVFLPCKDVDPELGPLIHALLTQDYPAYGVTFVVESTDDPAWARLRNVIAASSPIPTRILVAGRAEARGQKVHNLLVATSALPPSIEALAFLDSDIQIEPDWLSRLIEPLQKKEIGAVTGYRWFMPIGNTVTGAVLAALNADVAFVAGNHSHNAIWGGSWSILRATFEAAGIRRAWEGAITEDLSAWKAVRHADLRVAFEPSCLVVSPVRYNARGAIAFVRRQYLITRVYAPVLWLLLASGTILFTLTFWGGMVIGVRSLLLGRPAMWAAGLVVSLYVLGALRAAMRQSFIADRFPSWRETMSRSARLDIWARPFLALCNLALILSSAAGKRITWRAIRYEMCGPHRTRVLPSTALRTPQPEDV